MNDDLLDTTDSVLTETEHQKSSFSLLESDVLRQIFMIIALSICLALAIMMMLWVKEPEMRPLGAMETQELVETLDYLDQKKIDYVVDGNVVSVNAEKYQEIKLAMTRDGMIDDTLSHAGEEILLGDMGFGVSQRLEKERLKLSREKQLAEAIEAMKSVTKAQVLLAIPKQNVFAKREQKPSATVIVNIRRQNSLPKEEIQAIVDMVASAVHNLSPSRITVTDQHGRLLNSGSQDPLSSRTNHEFEIEQKQENKYKDKINSILIPVLGIGNFTAEVDIVMDFSTVEQTQKRYNPDLPAVRSELTVEEHNIGNNVIGIPGALTNQPPLPSNLNEDVTENENQKEITLPGRSHKEATRNYELDTTISHTRQQVGTIRRLSVSVAVDYLHSLTPEGNDVAKPRSTKELNDIKRLLQGGVGFNLSRGDTLEVVTIPFTRPDIVEDVELQFYEQEWFWRVMRIAGAVIVLIVLILAVIRPMLTKMMVKPEEDDLDVDLDGALSAYDDGDLSILNLNQSDDFGVKDGQFNLPDLNKDDDVLRTVRALVANEPALSALVIRNWVGVKK